MADSVNNNGKIAMLPIKEEKRPLLTDVNPWLVCFLCGGYFVDATTIIECLHTYCRSCIVQSLETTKFCPICEVQVHRTKPHLSLRPDPTMQRLVYKAVPGLYKNELIQRKKYLEGVKECNGPILNGDDTLKKDYYFSLDEPISISLEYIDRTDNLHPDVIKPIDKNDNVENEITHRRYLQCPARLKIRHIYKFIKLKYNLRRNQEVEILYDNTKLPGFFSLMDVAYTFSWKRETPMRLCYQILESKIIQVPQTVTDKMSEKSVPVKNNFVTNSAPQNTLNNTIQDTNAVQFETTRGENFSTKSNLKRKPETPEITSNTKDIPQDEPSDSKLLKEQVKVDDCEVLEPFVKIPRISNTALKDIMENKKESHEEKPKPTATVSPCTENGLKLSLKPVVADDIVDDYIKYEQDIEEVEDDDDDEDNDRLRISHLSEEDTQDDKTDNSDKQLVIDTSDFESIKEHKEEKHNGESKKSAKYKRKNKKSKHSHHHKHHRHHDRKKQATPQATILHSPDTDIMKLKFKLNNVKPEVKHHKQRRKRKKSSECYFSSSFSSSSSVSSASSMSPDAHNTSKADDDSLHSHTSELSVESLDTTTSKGEPSPKMLRPEEPADNKYRSPSSKEKLLQMRSFRPKSIAVVKPEENHKLEKHVDKPKNDNNNNDNTPSTESKEKPKPAPTLLRPPSSITVSKITAAEKQKMEQEKLLMMNGNNDDKPSLEIMLVNGPPSSTTDVKKPKTPPRQIRPPPAAIPLVQYHKMKSNEQNIPKSLTITPQIQRPKSTAEGIKKPKDTLSIRNEGAKRSVTVSLSGNPFENDFTGALDLSGKSPKYPDMINVPQTLLNKKLCMNGTRPLSNGIRPMLNGLRPMLNGLRPMLNGMSNYSPVRCMTNLADNVRPFHKTLSPNRYPMSSSPKHKLSVSSPQTSPKSIPSRPITTKNKPNVPNLNEIKIGPVSSTTEIPLKPGPNQTVRHIPNPSIMLQRHQATVNSISSINGAEYLPIRLPNSTTIMNHRVTSNACSFSTLKKNEKCPPAIPIKGYMDVSTK